MTLQLLLCASVAALAAAGCPEGEFIVGDMGDGDQKLVTIKGASLTIGPHANNESWVIKTKYDLKTCSAMIDFHVKGKPNPPPAGVVLLVGSRMHICFVLIRMLVSGRPPPSG
jgi:hypothetical protein